MSHISCNDESWHSYTSPKEHSKNIWITWHTPWVLLTLSFFHWKSSNFPISRNTDKDCILIHNSLNFSWLFKDYPINMLTILMMSGKLVIPGLLKIKVFLNKCVIIWRHKIRPWHHQQNLIRWFKLYCRCGHVTKVW